MSAQPFTKVGSGCDSFHYSVYARGACGDAYPDSQTKQQFGVGRHLRFGQGLRDIPFPPTSPPRIFIHPYGFTRLGGLPPGMSLK